MSVFARTDKVKELYKKLGNGKIKIVAGVRRCGKTYLLDTLFYKFILSKKYASEKTFVKVYLTGKHKNYKNKDTFKSLLVSFAKNNPRIIMIDEVQEAENYCQILKEFIYDYPQIDLYITGSNSNTLSDDIVENFKEIADTLYLFPLTFKEIRKSKTAYQLLDYLKYGGLPTVVNSKNKQQELDFIYDNVYRLDILDRVKKESFVYLSNKDMESIIDNLVSGATAFSTVETVNKMCSRYVPDVSTKMQIKKEIENFLDIVTKSFLFNTIENESIPDKKPLDLLGLNKKYYCCDCGIAYNKCKIAKNKLTLSLETAVYLHLKKNKLFPTCLLLFGKRNNVNGEIDFNYPNNHVQVTYELLDGNYNSEIGNLIVLADTCQKTLVYIQTSMDRSLIDKCVALVDAETFLTSAIK